MHHPLSNPSCDRIILAIATIIICREYVYVCVFPVSSLNLT